jgi:hypothetical protein
MRLFTLILLFSAVVTRTQLASRKSEFVSTYFFAEPTGVIESSLAGATILTNRGRVPPSGGRSVAL